MSEKIFRNLELNGNLIESVGSLQILNDATSADQAVRKSQAESVAATASQAILVDQSSNASASTAFTSQSLVSMLSAKQDNLSVHTGSSAYLEIINGTQLKINRLTTTEVFIDETSSTLAQAIGTTCVYSAGWTCNGQPVETGDVVILNNATQAQEKSWIHNGKNTGTFEDFTRLQTDYDEQAIRSMFNNGAFLAYDQTSGTMSVVTGTGVAELGAQTLPMDSTKFTTLDVSNSNVEFALLALESLINAVDGAASGGTATTNARLNNLAGVTGSNLETFANGIFSSNASIKTVLQETETLLQAAAADRGAIRQENIAQAAQEAAALSTEAAARTQADATLQANINTVASTESANNTAINALVNANEANSIAADAALDARLDVVQGGVGQSGSIAKAQADAIASAASYTNGQINSERDARVAAVNALDIKVDNLAEGDIQFVGQIESDGTISIRQSRIDAGDTRNGADFNNVALSAGEMFVLGAGVTVTYTDSEQVAYEQGDRLLLVDDVLAGALVRTDINAVPVNATALAVANVGTDTIDFDGSNKLEVVDNSIGREQLDAAIEADVDDKRSLTTSNSITSDSDTHFVTDVTTGAEQNIYYKRTSNTTDALTGTKRAVLGELFVSSNGSGNPAAPVYAHTATYSTHYQGNCVDLSMAIGGINAEANANASSAVYATGVYAMAMKEQLGINAGVTGVAQGAGISNIGVTGFGKTGGVGKDRGGVFAIADFDFLTWAGLRSANPVSYPDAALIADAGYAATAPAFVAVGKSVLDGDLDVTGDANFSGSEVVVPLAVNDNNAVNISNIKQKQAIYEFDLSDGVAKEVPTTLDLNKVIWRFINESTTVDVDVTLDASNNKFIVTATGGSLNDVRLLVQELSCSVISV
tara:strand:+ start:12108 stop:14756 length:2649 start_codon:yes stop_codon:yes gene_type:complete